MTGVYALWFWYCDECERSCPDDMDYEWVAEDSWNEHVEKHHAVV